MCAHISLFFALFHGSASSSCGNLISVVIVIVVISCRSLVSVINGTLNDKKHPNNVMGFQGMTEKKIQF